MQDTFIKKGAIQLVVNKTSSEKPAELFTENTLVIKSAITSLRLLKLAYSLVRMLEGGVDSLCNAPLRQSSD